MKFRLYKSLWTGLYHTILLGGEFANCEGQGRTPEQAINSLKLAVALRRRVSGDKGPRGVSSDSTQIDEISKRVFQHLISTPHHYVEFDEMEEEYNPPAPTSVTSKRVRFRYVGPGKPLPLDEDNDDA